MNKKILAIVLCAATTLSILTGCGDTQVTPNEPAQTVVADTFEPKTTESTNNDKTNKNHGDEHDIRLTTDSDEFIVNTDYDFSDPYSLQNVTEILDYVERENGDNTDNTILSETSLNMALSLLLEGANEDTDSYNALIQYLNGTNYPATLAGIRARNNALISRYMFTGDSNYLSIANSAWFNYGVNPMDNYTNVIGAYYNGRVQSLDFTNAESAGIINAWCEGATNGMIPSIITPEVLAQNDGVLINSIYFNDTWQTAFDEDNCREATFTNANGSTSIVNMMYQYDIGTYYESNWAIGFMKPYANSNLVFVGILPKENTNFAVSDLDIDDLLSNPVYGYEVNIGIPQFRISDENHLYNALYENGLAPAFASGNNDYTGCLCDVPVSVSNVIQKTYVDVNPEGTEAAATTAITVEKTAAPARDMPTQEIILDRPFVFMIYDTETHECLFIGKINNL